MKNVTMSNKKEGFKALKTATENYLTKVEEIINDNDLQDQGLLKETLQSLRDFREKCEEKLRS